MIERYPERRARHYQTIGEECAWCHVAWPCDVGLERATAQQAVQAKAEWGKRCYREGHGYLMALRRIAGQTSEPWAAAVARQALEGP